MPNPQHLASFAAIIQAGSISAAAAKRGCGKSVVSRQLAKLEEELGARLIQRSTRHLALTEIGQLVLQQARQIEQALENIGQITDHYQQQVRGTLRVSAAISAQRVLVPLLADHPLPPSPASYAIYPAREFLPLKTAAFIDFLQQRMRAPPHAEVASP